MNQKVPFPKAKNKYERKFLQQFLNGIIIETNDETHQRSNYLDMNTQTVFIRWKIQIHVAVKVGQSLDGVRMEAEQSWHRVNFVQYLPKFYSVKLYSILGKVQLGTDNKRKREQNFEFQKKYKLLMLYMIF